MFEQIQSTFSAISICLIWRSTSSSQLNFSQVSIATHLFPQVSVFPVFPLFVLVFKALPAAHLSLAGDRLATKARLNGKQLKRNWPTSQHSHSVLVSIPKNPVAHARAKMPASLKISPIRPLCQVSQRSTSFLPA